MAFNSWGEMRHIIINIIFLQIILILFLLSVDCQWSPYGGWSECSATCGGGIRSSERTKTQAKANGGKECIGNDTKIEICMENLCPGTSKINIAFTCMIDNLI